MSRRPQSQTTGPHNYMVERGSRNTAKSGPCCQRQFRRLHTFASAPTSRFRDLQAKNQTVIDQSELFRCPPTRTKTPNRISCRIRPRLAGIAKLCPCCECIGAAASLRRDLPMSGLGNIISLVLLAVHKAFANPQSSFTVGPSRR